MNFLIFINNNKDKDCAVACQVVSFLTDRGATVFLDNRVRDIISNKKILSCSEFYELESIVSDVDAAIVIGGDGTILKASKLLYGKDIPIVGINMGKVGYMSELEKNELDHLSSLLEETQYHKYVTTDDRMMLSCTVIRNNEEVYSNVCLNEVVVAKGDIARMIDLDLVLDGNVIAEYQSDGMIVATPTGSTAYAMSAGGAIIDPKIECISVVPLCPYLCINSSPIIFSKESVIEITYKQNRDSSAYISADGEEGFRLLGGDRIVIKKAEHSTRLLRFKKVDFYKLLNTKLTNRLSELTDKN